MSFTQLIFLFVFFPLSLTVYFVAYKLSRGSTRICNGIILIESIIFIAWADFRLIGFFLSIALLTHLAGVVIYKSRHGERKNESELLLFFMLSLTVMILAVYKYLPSIKIVKNGEAVTMPLFTNIIVPIGILFLSLEVLSYVLDIYTGKAEPGSITDTFTFLLFFPKFVCGPAVLWRDIKPQLTERRVTLEKINTGLRRIIIGLAKKAILADTFAAQIALIDSHASVMGADVLTMWLRAILFFFRIYCDFSGYSDMAVGLSMLFGFDLGENFNYPYKSSSVTDFWRRWHISLGKWMREYIYIPLGGNRRGIMQFNVLATFVIAGMWHGWSLRILLWSTANALVVIAEKKLKTNERYRSAPSWIKMLGTALIVMMGWIIFVSPDLATAGKSYEALFVSTAATAVPNFTWHFYMTRSILCFLAIAAFGAFGGFLKIEEIAKKRLPGTVADIVFKIAIAGLLALDIMFILGAYPGQPFLYSAI